MDTRQTVITMILADEITDATNLLRIIRNPEEPFELRAYCLEHYGDLCRMITVYQRPEGRGRGTKPWYQTQACKDIVVHYKEPQGATRYKDKGI
jgi:hypothetical protein